MLVAEVQEEAFVEGALRVRVLDQKMLPAEKILPSLNACCSVRSSL